MTTSSASIPAVVADHSAVNVVGHDQISYNVYCFPQPGQDNPNHEPGAVQRINDAPVDLLSTHFTGREKELDFIKIAMSKSRSGVPNRCAIYGMPGIGKSQLLLLYVKLSFDQYRYIFWTSAATVDKLNQGFAKILDLVGHPDRNRQEQSAKLTSARLWLEGSHGDDSIDWLLIFDNVQSGAVDFLRSHLPRSNARGNIIFTTRTAEVAEALVHVAGEEHPMLGIRVLDVPETTNLLIGDAGIDSGKVTPSMLSQVEDLVKCVGRLPLAVVQAASYMKQTGTTLDDMLKLYHNERKIEVIRWENNLTSHEERSVAATLTNQLDQLNRESRDIHNLLKVLSFFDPEIIPVEMVVEGAQVEGSRRLQEKPQPAPLERKPSTLQKLKKWSRLRGRKDGLQSDNISPTSTMFSESQSLISLILSPIEFQKAIQTLSNLSLIEHQSSMGDPWLRIHDLIRFMVRESTKTEETDRKWLQSSVSFVCGAFKHVKDPQSVQSWVECEKFIPHIRSLNEAWNDAYGMNADLIDAKENIAVYLRSRGRYDEAEELCKQTLEVREKYLGSDRLPTFESMNHLASVYFSQGRYDEAEELHKRVLTGWTKHLGTYSLKTLASINNLAAVYQLRGQYDQAEELHDQVLVKRKKRLGDDHPDTLLSMSNLALVYRLQGRYDEAEAMHKQVVAGREKILGVDHPDTLSSMNNLAAAHQLQGRYAEAEVLHKRVLASREKNLGSDHPDTLRSMNNLAVVCQLQERYDEAEVLHQRVSAGWEKNLGTEHPDTLTSMNNLASVYRSQGKYDEAEALNKKVLAFREKVLGTHHPDTLSSRKNLALVYQSQERYGEAEALHEQVLASRKEHLGADHPDTLLSMNNLATLRQSQGRYDEAAALYKMALAGQEKRLGSGHPETRKTADELANICRLQGQPVEADATERQSQP